MRNLILALCVLSVAAHAQEASYNRLHTGLPDERSSRFTPTHPIVETQSAQLDNLLQEADPPPPPPVTLAKVVAPQQMPLGGIPISSGPALPSVVHTFNTGLITTTTTLAVGTPTAGNILVSVQYWGGGNGGVLNFTDTFGNTASALKAENLIVDGDTIAIVCAPVTTGGVDTVTFTQSGTASAQRATVYEIHNSTGTCAQDTTAVSANPAGHVTACNSGNLTTSTANDMLIGACGGDGTSTSSIPAGSGWSGGTNTGNGGTQFILMSEWQVATTPGTFAATSGTIASQETAAIAVALKP